MIEEEVNRMTKKHSKIINSIGMTVGEISGDKVKEKFMEGYQEVEQAPAKDTDYLAAIWMKEAIERLDELVNEEARVRILESCGYKCVEKNPGHIERAVRRRQKFKTLEAFLAAEMKKSTKGTRVEVEGDVLYQYYMPGSYREGMRCYCGVWKGLPSDEKASLSWCNCAKGFIEKIWAATLEKPVQVELLKSCIAGDKECKFAVYL